MQTSFNLITEIKAGTVIPETTIQPMSDPETSDEEKENDGPLLGEYDHDDLRKVKTII